MNEKLEQIYTSFEITILSFKDFIYEQTEERNIHPFEQDIIYTYIDKLQQLMKNYKYESSDLAHTNAKSTFGSVLKVVLSDVNTK